MNKEIKQQPFCNGDFLSNFKKNGFFISPPLINRKILSQARHELHIAIEKEKKYSAEREGSDELQVICCPYYHHVFLELLSNPIFDRVDQILGRSSIIYSYNNSSMPAGRGNFSSKIHRDAQHSTGDHMESVGVLILLDDFTKKNGATWFLPGSHTMSAMPQPEQFYREAARLIAPAGSVFYFHPRLIHAGGVNSSKSQRDALAVGFVRPYMKQRLNLASILEKQIPKITDNRLIQKIGLSSQPPKSIEEFYKNQSLWNE